MDFYSVYIIGPRDLQCETNLFENMGWESSNVVRFDIEPLLQGQARIAEPKSVFTHLLLVLEVQCETYLWEIMFQESSDVVRFDLGSLLQGQTRTV